MKINDFKLECYFGEYEFTAPYLLAQSDCEAMTIKELLDREQGAEQEFLNQWLGYTETWGDPELRTLIAGLYETMSDQDVLVFHGAQEAIFGYMNVMLNQGDHMIVMYPNYPSAYEVAKAVPDCQYSHWEIVDDGEKWVLDFERLEGLIQPNTKIIAVNSPNNPTGYTLTNEEIEKLCDICKKYNLHLFADEVYKGLELDGEKRVWMSDRYDKCASLGVMSKSYGLAGLRVGWVASKDHDLLDKMVKMKHYMSICDSAPSEFLSKVALKHSAELLDRNLELIRSNIALANEFFDRYPNVFEKKDIMAGSVAFHKILLPMSATEFCKRAVEKKGVLLLPSQVFDTEDVYFRMGYGRKNFSENLKKLEEFIVEEGFDQ